MLFAALSLRAAVVDRKNEPVRLLSSERMHSS
jgi:hypothetical protein